MQGIGNLMFRNEKRGIANFQADYATPADFCKILENDMKSFYLLAFLLTANHNDAQQCFASTLDAALKEQTVFKSWAQAWVKRSLIKNAIRVLLPVSGRGVGTRDLWNIGQAGTPGDSGIDAVTRLAPLERFIFVMSTLERYSAWECSVLLNCDMKEVVQVRTRALRVLPGLDALRLSSEATFSRSLQATA
jgi:hypothetical protein